MLTTLLRKNARKHCNNSSVWSFETFKILSAENYALLAARLPLSEAALPQEGGNESDLIMDLFQEVPQVSEVPAMESALQIREKKKITR